MEGRRYEMQGMIIRQLLQMVICIRAMQRRPWIYHHHCIIVIPLYGCMWYERLQ